MGFVKMFWKIEDAHLPKISISGKIFSEILAQLRPDDSLQILLNLTWESSEHNWANISRDDLPHNASFQQTGLLDVFLSEYPDKSNNLKFICFYDVTLYANER